MRVCGGGDDDERWIRLSCSWLCEEKVCEVRMRFAVCPLSRSLFLRTICGGVCVPLSLSLSLSLCALFSHLSLCAHAKGKPHNNAMFSVFSPVR